MPRPGRLRPRPHPRSPEGRPLRRPLRRPEEHLAAIEDRLRLAGDVDEDRVVGDLDDLAEDDVARVDRGPLARGPLLLSCVGFSRAVGGGFACASGARFGALPSPVGAPSLAAVAPSAEPGARPPCRPSSCGDGGDASSRPAAARRPRRARPLATRRRRSSAPARRRPLAGARLVVVRALAVRFFRARLVAVASVRALAGRRARGSASAAGAARLGGRRGRPLLGDARRRRLLAQAKRPASGSAKACPGCSWGRAREPSANRAAFPVNSRRSARSPRERRHAVTSTSLRRHPARWNRRRARGTRGGSGSRRSAACRRAAASRPARLEHGRRVVAAEGAQRLVEDLAAASRAPGAGPSTMPPCALELEGPVAQPLHALGELRARAPSRRPARAAWRRCRPPMPDAAACRTRSRRRGASPWPRCPAGTPRRSPRRARACTGRHAPGSWLDMPRGVGQVRRRARRRARARRARCPSSSTPLPKQSSGWQKRTTQPASSPRSLRMNAAMRPGRVDSSSSMM